MTTPRSREEEREMEIDFFNSGPTNGTLSDKRRLAFIYEEILNVRDALTKKNPTDPSHD